MRLQWYLASTVSSCGWKPLTTSGVTMLTVSGVIKVRTWRLFQRLFCKPDHHLGTYGDSFSNLSWKPNHQNHNVVSLLVFLRKNKKQKRNPPKPPKKTTTMKMAPSKTGGDTSGLLTGRPVARPGFQRLDVSPTRTSHADRFGCPTRTAWTRALRADVTRASPW